MSRETLSVAQTVHACPDCGHPRAWEKLVKKVEVPPHVETRAHYVPTPLRPSAQPRFPMAYTSSICPSVAYPIA